jgi:predicted phage terminase large subunit-like protein
VNPEGGKESRAAAVSPEVEAGNVYVPLSAQWVSDYVEEHAAFPNGAHDDQVDQTSQALLRFSRRRGGAAATEALAG